MKFASKSNNLKMSSASMSAISSWPQCLKLVVANIFKEILSEVRESCDEIFRFMNFSPTYFTWIQGSPFPTARRPGASKTTSLASGFGQVFLFYIKQIEEFQNSWSRESDDFKKWERWNISTNHTNDSTNYSLANFMVVPFKWLETSMAQIFSWGCVILVFDQIGK